MPVVTLPACNRSFSVPAGTGLADALKAAGLLPDAPCGGRGLCGKCRVLADGTEVLACQTTVERDMEVILPDSSRLRILQEGLSTNAKTDPVRPGALLAFDIGTTSLVCFLLDGHTGRELARSSALNPQTAFGADVITRVQAALNGESLRLTHLIREKMAALTREVCCSARLSPERIGVISVVGNPAMRQLFLGISPENLAKVPFAPVLTEAKTVPCAPFLPLCPNALLLLPPDISGYVGTDTLGCLLATELYQKEDITLLVDIGTNGELVLGNRERMLACATAAGPAFEGAGIRCGMRGTDGAIDHVWTEAGEIRCSVIGGSTARGICGSGLIDAVAAGLRTGLLNKRGRILNEHRIFPLTQSVALTQDDIRQVQLAKGAIAAGIRLMARELGIELPEIRKVLLAGAFGAFVNPASACRIGLLPEILSDRIEAVGNAAGSGAKLLARDRAQLQLTDLLAKKIEFLELASLPRFPRTFAEAMNFREESL